MDTFQFKKTPVKGVFEIGKLEYRPDWKEHYDEDHPHRFLDLKTQVGCILHYLKLENKTRHCSDPRACFWHCDFLASANNKLYHSMGGYYNTLNSGGLYLANAIAAKFYKTVRRQRSIYERRVGVRWLVTCVIGERGTLFWNPKTKSEFESEPWTIYLSHILSIHASPYTFDDNVQQRYLIRYDVLSPIEDLEKLVFRPRRKANGNAVEVADHVQA